MNTELDHRPATCAALFAREGLPPPPVPASLLPALHPVSDAAFATAGWSATTDVSQGCASWLAQPSQERAWAGFSGHGVRSTTVRWMVATPRCGIFVQRLWAQAHGEAAHSDVRVRGTFALAARVLAAADAVHAAGRWPADQRLAILDDDFGDELCWGWVPVGATALPALTKSPGAYIEVLMALEALGAPAAG